MAKKRKMFEVKSTPAVVMKLMKQMGTEHDRKNRPRRIRNYAEGSRKSKEAIMNTLLKGKLALNAEEEDEEDDE